MHNTSKCSQSLDNLQHKLQLQTAAVSELEFIMSQCAETLHRHDQMNCFTGFKSKIMQEIEDAKKAETKACAEFSETRLITGLARFAGGSIGAAISGRKSPLSVGAKLARSAWERMEPFGTVMLAIGKQGLPDDIRVISISRLAREKRINELYVTQSITDSGCLLITPIMFSKLVGNLEHKILDGSISLPIHNEELVGELKNT